MLAPLVCLAVVTLINARGTPPSINVPQGNKWPNPVVYVRNSNAKSFTCHAISTPEAKYYWTVNGTKVVNDVRTVTYNENTGVLTTGSLFGPLHTGDYQCIAFNDYGKAMTPFLNIQATRADPFPGGERTETDVKVFRYNYVKLECKDVPISVPQGKFSWKLVNDTLEENPVELGQRMIIDPEGSLHFLWTEMTDNGLTFACHTYNNVMLLGVTNTRTMRLTVETVNQGANNDRPPELKYHSDVEVFAGSNAELTCIFSYYSSRRETFTVSWRFRGNKVGEGSTLVIPTVKIPTGTETQEGEYQCEGKLGNFDPVRGTVHLKVVAPPEFILNQEPSSKAVPVGSNAVFTCGTTSHNSYSKPPVWLVNTVPLIGCPPRFFECKTPNPNKNGYSECIEERNVCDNAPDCNDQSDENNCPGSCPESQKRCNETCIPESSNCTEELLCKYPEFMCNDKKPCLQKIQVCDGTNQCQDGSDELACPNKQAVTRNRFTINSQRTELTIPRVSLTDSMCFQCMVTNDYGTVIGDGCISVIDKIVLGTRPNSTYDIEPAVTLTLNVDATTDALWQNQMKFQWFWYDEVEDEQTKETKLVQRQLPPAGDLGQYFMLSMGDKQMVIQFPEVPEGDEKAYNTYYAMKDRLYTIVISHQYDRLEYNFTINGINLVKPTPAPAIEKAETNLWFIALILAVVILFVVIALIICYLHRNRGGTYPLDKKEHQAGHDPAQELKDSGFHDVGRVDDDDFDKPKEDEASLSESVKPYESDDDPTEEYGGDFDVSKFNEDGSFIGLYGDKKSKYANEPKEATV